MNKTSPVYLKLGVCQDQYITEAGRYYNSVPRSNRFIRLANIETIFMNEGKADAESQAVSLDLTKAELAIRVGIAPDTLEANLSTLTHKTGVIHHLLGYNPKNKNMARPSTIK